MADPFSMPINSNAAYPDGGRILVDPRGTTIDDRFDLAFRTYLVPDSFVPLLLTQPQSQAVLAGATVRFSVGAIANAPLSYQWLFNGAPLQTQRNQLTLSAGSLKDWRLHVAIRTSRNIFQLNARPAHSGSGAHREVRPILLLLGVPFDVGRRARLYVRH
jgi:hypothetical protein